MCKYEDKSDSFNFEKTFCLQNLKVWRNEALNLFYSAEVLYHFEQRKMVNIFHSDEQLTALFSDDLVKRGCFNFRVQRMLWAYGFENLLKCIILAEFKLSNPYATEVPKNIIGHCLVKLAKDAHFTLSDQEEFYCGILEKCSVWAGRYPLPLSAGQMYKKREALSSREALHERAQNQIERWIKGEIPRTFTEADVIHAQIGYEEYSTCKNLKERLIAKVADLLDNEDSNQN
ncbi:MAG: hypothetical protein HZB23_07135 [Deltaproteobacteria bacterium]|nr:hypothetical protein [Deltaproteobacteria bacterium]